MPNLLDPTLIGGIFLVFGAISIYFGNAYWSIFFYFWADLCWVWLAYQHRDIWGIVSVTIGIVLGLLVWVKMHIGKFKKTIKKG